MHNKDWIGLDWKSQERSNHHQTTTENVQSSVRDGTSSATAHSWQREMDGWMDRLIDGSIDWWIDRWIDGSIDLDRSIDRTCIFGSRSASRSGSGCGCLRSCPKMWTHYLVGVSHFAKYGINRLLIVWEMLTNVQKSSFLQRWIKRWTDPESTRGFESLPKVSHF